MKTTLTTMLAALALALATPATAQVSAEYQAAEDALVAAWQSMPLAVRNASFVTEPASGYGLYTRRDNAVFAQGEPIIVYAEPLGYGWVRNEGEDTYGFGLSIDLSIRDAQGGLLGAQQDFQRARLSSRDRNREFYITLTLNLSDAPPGEYILEYLLHDLVEEQSTLISLPFTLTGS
ncbi:MAG: hypothetical protein KDK12_07380 [Rhodobacteraceae bacterium]|nr:hypothetical protein [Paracoccaceae bacterium]